MCTVWKHIPSLVKIFLHLLKLLSINKNTDGCMTDKWMDRQIRHTKDQRENTKPRHYQVARYKKCMWNDIFSQYSGTGQGLLNMEFKISDGDSIWSNYDTCSTYSTRQAWESSADQDQMAQNEASDQDHLCLLLIQQLQTHSQVVNGTLKF